MAPILTSMSWYLIEILICIYLQVRKQQLELDMEQQTGSKLRKEYIRLYVVHLLI